jgi:hypothetical protein
MGKIMVDAILREKLNGLHQQIEICDENDQLVGVFLPAAEFRALTGSTEIPFTDEEIELAKNSGGGCSLAEFWKRMGVS